MAVDQRQSRLPLSRAELVGRAASSAERYARPVKSQRRPCANVRHSRRTARSDHAAPDDPRTASFLLVIPQGLECISASTSKAAASASALSFRRSSRCGPTCFTCGSSNAALASRDSGAVALQNASSQALSWFANNPFSRHYACSCVSGMACVLFSASKRWAGLYDGAGKSAGSCAAGPPTSCF